MNSKKQIEDFLAQKNIAVAGVSRNSKKFGNTIYRELKKMNYNLFPVNPNCDEIEGDKCFRKISDIPEIPEALIINLPPQNAVKILVDAGLAGINKVWLQQGSQSHEAVKFCEDNGISCISNECVLMFAEPAAFIHRAHRWVRSIRGRLPYK